MTDELARTTRAMPGAVETGAFPTGAWVRANTTGLALALGLFALAGGTIEALGASHDSVTRNLPALLALMAGGAVLALLRRRALGAGRAGTRWHLLIIAGCVPVGLVLGLGAAPFDWTMAMLVTGTVGGALQLRAWRPVSARGLLVTAGTWLAAAVVATIAVILLMDGIVGGLIGLDMEQIDADPGALSAALFAVAFTVVGLVGGAVGGALEGIVLQRRLHGRR